MTAGIDLVHVPYRGDAPALIDLMAGHIPVQFWWLSLGGGIIVTIYGLLRRDPVIILGQAPGLIVYARNLVLIHRHAERQPTEDSSPDRA